MWRRRQGGQNGIGWLQVGYQVFVNTQVYLWRLGRTVIDTGCPNQWSNVKPFLNREPTDVVVVSHHHEDHAGNGAAIQRELGIPVLAPPLTQRLLVHQFKQETYRQLVWGIARPYTPSELPAKLSLADMNATLISIATPGHCIDHHCFYVPERGLLFTSDLYVARRRKDYRNEEDASVELSSLQTVAKLDFDTVLCSHRGLITDGKQAIKDRIEFLTELLGHIRELQQRGLSYHEISLKLLGREDFLYYFSLGDFSKRNLIETLARHKQ